MKNLSFILKPLVVFIARGAGQIQDQYRLYKLNYFCYRLLTLFADALSAFSFYALGCFVVSSFTKYNFVFLSQ